MTEFEEIELVNHIKEVEEELAFYKNMIYGSFSAIKSTFVEDDVQHYQLTVDVTEKEFFVILKERLK